VSTSSAEQVASLALLVALIVVRIRVGEISPAHVR